MRAGRICLVLLFMLSARSLSADHFHPLDFEYYDHADDSLSSIDVGYTYLGRELLPLQPPPYYWQDETPEAPDTSALINPEILDGFDERPAPPAHRAKTRRRQQTTPTHTPTTAHGILYLSGRQCRALLRRKGVRFKTLSTRRGVRYPIRVLSKLGGVRYRQSRKRTRYAVMDCRLAVALLGWSPILRRQGIYEVIYSRTWTPGATVRRTGRPSGHRWALAIDVTRFKSRRYGTIHVKYDWLDRRKGISPCRTTRRREATTQRILRTVVCRSASRRLFGVILTPHYNRAHHNHLHIELRPNSYRMVLR